MLMPALLLFFLGLLLCFGLLFLSHVITMPLKAQNHHVWLVSDSMCNKTVLTR